MPSNVFMHYTARQIPEVMRKYLKKRFGLMEDLCDLNILQCPVCATSLTGVWRTQLNTLVIGAME